MEQNLEPESGVPENSMNDISEELGSMLEIEETNVDDQTTKKIQSANLTVEELENRLAIGETVDDEHTAYALYCEYSCAKGFSVKKGNNSYSRKRNFLIGKFFNCSNEGAKDEKYSINRIPNYQKSSSRCGCPAKLKISRRKGQPWRVSTFETSHNHDLHAPDESYLLRSQCRMTEDDRVLFNTICKVVPPSKAFGLMKHLANGHENVGFTKRDAFNENGRQKKRIEGGDAINVLNYLKNKSNTENNFVWNIEVEDDITLMNIFFRDSQSFADYESFGDIVSFDTTYKTNKYGLKCAPFVDINHHNKNTMFGFAMLADETQSTFEWLFRTFLESMAFKHPQVIFTDQSQAMMNAIKTVFPSTCHRLCQWHINQNAPSHFGSLNSSSCFKNMWKKCMRYCNSEEEFEATWKKMDTDYGVGRQNWFNMMYKLRDKWATAFSNNIFTAGLLASSRSEGTNKALKVNIGNATHSMLDCVKGCDEVVTEWRIKEREMSSHSHHRQPPLWAPENPLLRHAAEVYTHKIFSLFQVEMKNKDNFKCVEISTELSSLSHIFQVISFKEEAQYFKTVVFRSDTSEILCSCHHFETTGLFCSHILRVCSQVNLCNIPDRYILKRWTKGAKKSLFIGEHSCNARETSVGLSEIAFVNRMLKKVHDLAMKCKGSEDARNLLSDCLHTGAEKISAWMLVHYLNASGDMANCNEEVEKRLHEPPLAKEKGIVSIQKCHWDDKRKRRNVKVAKHKGQSSQKAGDDMQFSEGEYRSSQNMCFISQRSANLRTPEPQWSVPMPFSHGHSGNVVGGEFPMGVFSSNNRLSDIYLSENSQGQSNC